MKTKNLILVITPLVMLGFGTLATSNTLGTLSRPASGDTLSVSWLNTVFSEIEAAVNSKQDTLTTGSVTGDHILDGTVGTNDLATGSVTSDHILDGTVGTSDLATGSVTGDHILDGTVGTNDLATGAVDAFAIGAGAVHALAIGNGAVINSKIAAGAVTSNKIAAGAVDTAALAGSSVTNAKIATGAVASLEVADNSLTSLDTSNEAGTDGTNGTGTFYVDSNSGDATYPNARNVASTTITVPSAGVVLVTCSGTVMLGHANGTISKVAWAIDNTAAVELSTGDYTYNYVELDNNLPNGEYHFPINCMSTIAVGAAGTITYYLDVQVLTPDAGFINGGIIAPRINAIFLPTRY